MVNLEKIKTKPIHYWYFLVILLFLSPIANSKNLIEEYPYQFLSYDKVPAWVGVISAWQSQEPQVNLYNPKIYKGHADFVAKGLKRGIDFREFKNKVKDFTHREYLPLMIYDLSQYPLKINNTSYTWAVRLIDYGFTDNAEQMTQTNLRLLEVVKKFLTQDPRFSKNGILILSLNKKIQSPDMLKPLLIPKGYQYQVLNDLIRLSKSPLFKIMNPGVGVGYLRYIPEGKENSLLPSKHEITIFEKLPYRLPPVAGIITIEPQTELAHVNLLAKNRGTFNLFTTELEIIPGLKEKIGKLVKVDARTNKVRIEEISLADAKKFWNKNKPSQVQIPQARRDLERIISLANIDSQYHRVEYIGAKAANYALIQKEFPENVRPGFALPFKTYFEIIHTSGAQKLIDQFILEKNKLNLSQREARLKKIQEKILNTPIPIHIIRQIRILQMSYFPNRRIRLRSSTNCEDLANFNGAGLYLSKGLNSGDSNKKLQRKILKIYASLWSPLAFEERELYQIDHNQAGMAILINEAFTNEYANGVVVTTGAKNGNQILINSQLSDHLITNPESGVIPESLIFDEFDKDYYRIENTSSLGNVLIKNIELNSIIWDIKKITVRADHLLKSQLDITERDHYGIDIEFKVMKEGENYKLYIKQLRLLSSNFYN